jgi:hypothetical protein
MRPCFASCYERTSEAEDPEPGPPTISTSVERCKGLNGSDDPCGLVARFDPEHCSQAVPCDGLVAVFGMSSEECGGYGRVLRDIAEAGYVATCLHLFDDDEVVERLPLVELADRVDRSLEAIHVSEAITGRWTGRYFFLTGVGVGATVPVVAMARTDLDESAHWRGAEVSGACFLDGFYDLAAADTALGEGLDGLPCTFPLSHAELLARYYDPPPESHDCEGGQCPCGEEHSPAIDVDSVVDVDPLAVSVPSWALIECGSELDTCTDDVAPAAPIRTLCEALDSDVDHDCVFESLPRADYRSCMSFGAERCLAFFEELSAR